MLGTNKGQLLREYPVDYVLFDLETTGLSCKHDQIIEIAAIKVCNGKIYEEYSRLINPGRHIPSQASAVNNIYDNMVANAPMIGSILPEFLEFVGDSILAGHNIHSFDMNFIYRDCMDLFGKTLINNYVDTLYLARELYPNIKSKSLGNLAKLYGLSTDGAHRSLADCRLNYEVFKKMSEESQGNSTLKLCSECKRPMIKRNGKYGEFWGCTGYPKCRHTENIV